MHVRRTKALKRLALVAWTAVAVAITLIQAARASKWLTWEAVIAVSVFLTAAVLSLCEGWMQGLRGLLQKSLSRELTFIVLAIVGFLMLAAILRFD
jgi:hypothetical protein